MRWAIVSYPFNSVLNKDGAWEFEPSPSSRDNDFIARTRWDSEEDALAFLEKKYKEPGPQI